MKLKPQDDSVEVIGEGTRYYRIRLYGYGGEGAYINISKEAHDFWHEHTEEHGDGDFVTYMVNDAADCEFEELVSVPEDADFLKSEDGEYKHQWYEAPGEFCHQHGVEYGSARIEVEEVSSNDYMTDVIATLIDGENVSELYDKVGDESDWDIDITKYGYASEDEAPGDYVAQMYSIEKGSFFDGVIETVGEFDVKKLKFIINEYPNSDDIIDGIEYAGNDIENNGGDTNGKGYVATVWKNGDNT